MSEPRTPPGESFRILFLCTGNTCRSPMVAALARAAVARRGWSHVEVRSAGVAAPVGAPAADHAVAALEERGLDLSDHAARQLDEADVDWADLIVGMSASHVHEAEALGGAGKTALATEFLAGEGRGGSVADPFGGDMDTYRVTLRELDGVVEALLQRLEPILSP